MRREEIRQAGQLPVLLLGILLLTQGVHGQRKWGREAAGRQLQTLAEAFPAVECPADPIAYCDFFFSGYETEVPVLSISGLTDNPASPLILDSKTSSVVEVDQSGDVRFLCSSENGIASAGGQFYIASSRVFFHVFNYPYLESYFENQCYILPVTSSFLNGENLNPGDKNSAYPESRRCIVFKTGPEGPSDTCAHTSAPLASPPPPALTPTLASPPHFLVASSPPPPGVSALHSPLVSPPPPSPTLPPPSPKLQKPIPTPAPTPSISSPLPAPAPAPKPESPPPTPISTHTSTPTPIPAPTPAPLPSSPPPLRLRKPAPLPAPAPVPFPSPPLPVTPAPAPVSSPPSPSPPPPSPPPQSPPPPPTPAPPPICVTQCPSNPLQNCNFYFAGHEHDVPTFPITGITPDTVALSPPIQTLIGNVGVNVEVDATRSGIFLGCPLLDSSQVNDFFYANGDTGMVYLKTVQANPSISYFQNRCVQLPLSAVQIRWAGFTYNLPGDLPGSYPESRMCVNFNTGA